ncbi:MAG: rhomboid family intramembrane serine protease [Candidatus Pacearchaeota archaeon]|jgi:membrane associated rhomboid family serine protease
MNKTLRTYTRKNLGESFFSKLSITTWLIIVNVIAFILVQIVLVWNKDLLQYLALTPAYVVHGKYLWTIVTSVFMHADIMHLLFNMISLFFIGKFVEKILGRKRFLSFYLIAGIFASIMFALLAGYFGVNPFWGKILGDPLIPGVGASGAIFGLIGVLALLTPKARVYLIAGPLIAIVIEAIIGSVPQLSAVYSIVSVVVSVYIVISLFAMFSFRSKWLKISLPVNIPFWSIPIIAIVPLIIIGFFWPLPIGNIAHLAGFAAGAVYGLYLRSKYPNKIKLLNRYIGVNDDRQSS